MKKSGASAPEGRSDLIFEVDGNDRSSLRLSLHVSSWSTSLDPSFLDTFGIITDECCEDEVGRGLSTELTLIVIKVYCHKFRM